MHGGQSNGMGPGMSIVGRSNKHGARGGRHQRGSASHMSHTGGRQGANQLGGNQLGGSQFGTGS